MNVEKGKRVDIEGRRDENSKWVERSENGGNKY